MKEVPGDKVEKSIVSSRKSRAAAGGRGRQTVKDLTWLLLYTSLLASGFNLDDPTQVAGRPNDEFCVEADGKKLKGTTKEGLDLEGGDEKKKLEELKAELEPLTMLMKEVLGDKVEKKGYKVTLMEEKRAEELAAEASKPVEEEAADDIDDPIAIMSGRGEEGVYKDTLTEEKRVAELAAEDLSCGITEAFTKDWKSGRQGTQS